MNYLFTFFTALVVSMTIIPLMIRLTPRLGMLDYPDRRKVHTTPISRAGGVGIVIGALIPILLWMPLDEAVLAYLFGSLVLLAFGMWDDIRNLGPYPKFLGQFAAAIAVVYYGDVYITSLPFMEIEQFPAGVAKPFTVVAIVGMINALNVSDGLDGLAGGLSILSLICISYLAFLADGTVPIYIVVATLGGVLGFLRYNTHPATVFMGDGGSQFLGFTLGFLTVMLVQRINPALSPSLPVLILGLPVIDILAVIVQRIYSGISPFVASKHHIHHRFLEIGFDHYEAVVIIYFIQAMMIAGAILLSYESDWTVLATYLSICTLIYLFLFIAIRKGWRAHQAHTVSKLAKVIQAVKEHDLFVAMPMRYVNVVIPVLFVLVSLLADNVPRDFAIASAVLSVVLLLFLVSGGSKDSSLLQAINYVTAAFVVYLGTKYINAPQTLFVAVELSYFVVLAAAVGLTIRYSGEIKFRTTPMDYLVIIIVLFAGFLLRSLPEKAEIGMMAAKLIVLFYGCELIITRMRNRWGVLNISTLLTLTVFAVRGLV